MKLDKLFVELYANLYSELPDQSNAYLSATFSNDFVSLVVNDYTIKDKWYIFGKPITPSCKYLLDIVSPKKSNNKKVFK